MFREQVKLDPEEGGMEFWNKKFDLIRLHG